MKGPTFVRPNQVCKKRDCSEAIGTDSKKFCAKHAEQDAQRRRDRYKAKTSLGICAYQGCLQHVAPGSVADCILHRDRRREHDRKLEHAKLAKGVCVIRGCHQPRHKSKRMCVEHLKRDNAKRKRWRDNRRSLGLCVECPKPPRPSLPDKSRCEFHEEKNHQRAVLRWMQKGKP